MSLTRSTLGASFLKPFLHRSTIAAPLSSRISTSIRTYASQDYGSGDGNPAGENPQDQGSNPSADLEHPGPPPPSAGQGSGGGPTKGTSSGHNTSENESSSSSSSTADKSSSSSSGSDSSSSTKGAQPKILAESPPAPEDQSQEVKQHNKEMDNRAEKAGENVEDL